MSRCILDNEELGTEVVIGWDPPMETYFARVAERNGEEVFWTGNGDRIYNSPDPLIEMIQPYACWHDKKALIRELRWDKATNDGSRIYSMWPEEQVL